MTSLNISLSPEQLEGEVEELRVMRGAAFSHLALAEAIWNDRYGELNDPSILGFRENQKNDKSLPIRMWVALKKEWLEFACTESGKYVELRKMVSELKGEPATVIVSSISVALAATLGVAAGVLVPFVVIFLHGVITLGNNAICRAME